MPTAVEYFLKVDGIKGESRDNKHEHQIEILSYHWGVTQTGTMAFGGGGGAGKAQFTDFSFTNNVSKASPLLFLKCANGEHIKEATLSARKAGGEQQDFLIIKMNDVLVSSYQTGGSSSSDAVPTDQVGINYAKIEYIYKPQRPDGSFEGDVSAGWDLKKNVKL